METPQWENFYTKTVSFLVYAADEDAVMLY